MRIKTKMRIRFKYLGNSHGLGRAIHTREKRNITPIETASFRDAESGRNPFLFLEREGWKREEDLLLWKCIWGVWQVNKG